MLDIYRWSDDPIVAGLVTRQLLPGQQPNKWLSSPVSIISTISPAGNLRCSSSSLLSSSSSPHNQFQTKQHSPNWPSPFPFPWTLKLYELGQSGPRHIMIKVTHFCLCLLPSSVSSRYVWCRYLGVSFSQPSRCLLLLRVGYKWLNKLLSMGTLIDTIFHLTVSTPQLYSSPRDGLIIAAMEPVSVSCSQICRVCAGDIWWWRTRYLDI